MCYHYWDISHKKIGPYLIFSFADYETMEDGDSLKFYYYYN